MAGNLSAILLFPKKYLCLKQSNRKIRFSIQDMENKRIFSNPVCTQKKSLSLEQHLLECIEVMLILQIWGFFNAHRAGTN
jgi:hypothetical protein